MLNLFAEITRQSLFLSFSGCSERQLLLQLPEVAASPHRQLDGGQRPGGLRPCHGHGHRAGSIRVLAVRRKILSDTGMAKKINSPKVASK